MSIVGVKELLKRVKEENLVEGLSERELNNPEGAGFDLRIGEIYEITGQGFLGVDNRETPKMNLITNFEEGKKNFILLEPGKYLVMKTIEKLNTPEDIVVIFRPRSTLYRSGVSLFTGNSTPGYCGELIFGIMNNNRLPFKLEMGSRVAHALFYKVEGGTNKYRGQWQGGRVSTKGIEKQV